MRRSTPAGWILGVVASGLALTAAIALPGLGTEVAAHKSVGVPSSDFWSRAGDVDQGGHALTGLSTVYEGPTDQNFLDYIKQADSLTQTGRPWTNVGPFGGVVDVPGQGSGNENFGPVAGIGTAIAVDPSDPTGNTAYLGTIGGLYRTDNGGKTVHDIIGDQLARDSVGAIAVDPTDPARVFAGTGVSIFTLSDDAAGTGVYVGNMDKDGKWTWTRPLQNTHGYGVNSIAVAPDGTVYAGTTYGLWVSRDHGGTFSQVHLHDNATHTAETPLPMGSWITSIAINPQNSQEVTVAVGYAFGAKKYPDGEVIAPGNGLYRSTDGGFDFQYLTSTQQLTWAGASSDPFGRTSLAYSTAPGTTGLMWALVADAGKTAGNHNCVDTPAVPVCLDGNSELNGVYRSSDDGATWQLEGTPQMLATAEGGTTSLAGNAIDYGPGVQGDYNNWILADPVDPNRVYIGLEEAFTGEVHDPTGALPVPSTTWATIEKYADVCGFLTYFNTIPNSNGVACPSQLPEYGGTTTHPDQHSAAFAKTPSGYRLYAGNDGGWWAQDAHAVNDVTSPQYQGFNSDSWSSLGKPATVLPWDVTRLQDGSYLLALQDNGVAHVRPDGSAYQVCGGDGVYVFPGKDASSYYCGIDGQQILATTDDFKHTTSITPSGNASGATFLSPWTVDATDPNHLLAAAENVDETDAGPNSNVWDPTDEVVLSTTWQTVFTPTPPKTGNWDSSAVYAQGPVDYVAFCSPCRPSLASGSAANADSVTDLIATNVKPKCKATVGSTDCWHAAASTGLPHEQVSGIAVDPSNPQTIYVSLRQFIVMGADPKVTGDQKVMVSYDGGKTFQDLTGNLPRADAHRIVLRDGQLYVATDVGIFTAPAGSTTWSRFDNGLPAVTYRSMKLDPTGRYLVAGAYGRGGWVYDFGPAAPVPGHRGAASVAPGSSTAPRAAASAAPRSDTASLASATGAGTGQSSEMLPFAGWNAVLAVAAALMLLASGTGLVMQARRRRQGGAPA